MKLARATLPSATNRPRPNFQGAAMGNKQQLLQSLLHLNQRIGDLEVVTGGGTINLQSPGRKQTPPPYAGFTASSTNGGVAIQITNPQFKTVRGNTRSTPVYHHIDLADDQQFTKNVVSLPVTSQTHIFVPQSKQYVRLRSSFDGVTKNSPQFASAS